MSVIWSGVTEEGAVVPVQVDETGKVIATAAVPGGDYVKKTGDNMTGNLTFDENITLSASDGSATFNKIVTVSSTSNNADLALENQTGSSFRMGVNPTAAYFIKGSAIPIVFYPSDGSQNTIRFEDNGSAAFAGRVTSSDGYRVLSGDKGFQSYSDSTAPIFVVNNAAGNSVRASVDGDGSATFAGGKCGFTSAGELFFTSRNTRYKLVVQDQVCLAEPYTRQMELKEKAEQFIADKRETKPSDPSDPDPSDPQSGVSMDIDNSSPKRD